MKGDNHFLAVTTTTDDVTGETKPLFGFPVQVCSGFDSTADPKFAVAAPSGKKREQVYKDPASGTIVSDDECPRGVFVGDEFREIPKASIDAVKETTSSKTMVVEGRLPVAEAFDKYGTRIIGRHFLQVPAQGGSAKAYRITYEALREVRKGKRVERPATALVTKRTARSREKLHFFYADERLECLVMVEVAFAATVKSPDEQVVAFQTAQVDERQIDVARQVIDGLGDGAAVLDSAEDRAVALKQDLIDKAVEGVEFVAPKPVAASVEEDSLDAMLAASVERVAAAA